MLFLVSVRLNFLCATHHVSACNGNMIRFEPVLMSPILNKIINKSPELLNVFLLAILLKFEFTEMKVIASLYKFASKWNRHNIGLGKDLGLWLGYWCIFVTRE
jgi:hypothetical protein